MSGEEYVKAVYRYAVEKVGESHVVYEKISDSITDTRVLNPMYNPVNNWRPKELSVSYDDEVGCFMSIDGFNWEFDNDTSAAYSTAKDYLDAMNENKVYINRKFLQRVFKRGRDIRIID